MDPTQTRPIHGSSGNTSIPFSKDGNPQIYFFLQHTQMAMITLSTITANSSDLKK